MPFLFEQLSNNDFYVKIEMKDFLVISLEGLWIG